jgi:hypothetical protein
MLSVDENIHKIAHDTVWLTIATLRHEPGHPSRRPHVAFRLKQNKLFLPVTHVQNLIQNHVMES